MKQITPSNYSVKNFKKGWTEGNLLYYYYNGTIYSLLLSNISIEPTEISTGHSYPLPQNGPLIHLTAGEKRGWYCFGENSYDTKTLFRKDLSSSGFGFVETLDNPFYNASVSDRPEFLFYKHNKYFAISKSKVYYSDEVVGNYKQIINEFNSSETSDYILDGHDLCALKIENQGNKTIFGLFKVANNGLPQVATQVVLNSPVTKTNLETMKITYRLKIA